MVIDFFFYNCNFKLPRFNLRLHLFFHYLLFLIVQYVQNYIPSVFFIRLQNLIKKENKKLRAFITHQKKNVIYNSEFLWISNWIAAASAFPHRIYLTVSFSLVFMHICQMAQTVLTLLFFQLHVLSEFIFSIIYLTRTVFNSLICFVFVNATNSILEHFI